MLFVDNPRKRLLAEIAKAEKALLEAEDHEAWYRHLVLYQRARLTRLSSRLAPELSDLSTFDAIPAQ